MSRSSGWSALVGWIVIAVVAVCGAVGWRYFAAIKECGAEDHLREHLRVGLAAEVDGADTLVLACGWGAEGCRAILGGRPIRMTANGKAIDVPPAFERPVYDTVHAHTGGVRFARLKPDEAMTWLGGPGTYVLTASIGPVESASVRVELPSLKVESPCRVSDLPPGLRP